MRYLYALVVSCALFYRASDELSVRLQKGSYSHFTLCKSSNPHYQRSSRSSIECFTFCQILLGNVCRSFKYQRKEKKCSLYDDIIRYDFESYPNQSCEGYQLVPGNYGSNFMFLKLKGQILKGFMKYYEVVDIFEQFGSSHDDRGC